jgi:DNA-binding MarR family transcriptional regulator
VIKIIVPPRSSIKLIISSTDDQHTDKLSSMAKRGETETQTRRRLAYLLKHAERRMSELHVEALSPLDIHARDLGVLLAIASNEPTSQQQIAQRMGVDRTTMVAIIDALEAKGLIARRPDSEDRRRNVVELTSAGQEILQAGISASDGAEAKLLAPLSPEENLQLRDLLARVIASV